MIIFLKWLLIAGAIVGCSESDPLTVQQQVGRTHSSTKNRADTVLNAKDCERNTANDGISCEEQLEGGHVVTNDEQLTTAHSEKPETPKTVAPNEHGKMPKIWGLVVTQSLRRTS